MSNTTAKRAKLPTAPTSARDMAMLRLAPVDGFAVPRLHVEPRHVGGGLRVLDRPSGTHVLVYTPRHAVQFRAGCRAGRWYVRSLTQVGGQPQSHDFDTARAAVEAVSRGAWSLSAARPAPSAAVPRIRVIWPDAVGLEAAV
jgi:hypothetical protein